MIECIVIFERIRFELLNVVGVIDGIYILIIVFREDVVDYFSCY